MTVDFSNLYANDTDYCDSPDTKNRNVRDNLSPAEVSSLKFVDCFVINGFNMFPDGQIAQETFEYNLDSIKPFTENDYSKTI